MTSSTKFIYYLITWSSLPQVLLTFMSAQYRRDDDWDHADVESLSCNTSPKKPTRFGIKVWVLAEAKSGYVFDFQVYMGARDDEKTEKIR